MNNEDISKKVKAGKYDEIDPDVLIGIGICPECYSKLENIQGCKECFSCGFSVCN